MIATATTTEKEKGNPSALVLLQTSDGTDNPSSATTKAVEVVETEVAVPKQAAPTLLESGSQISSPGNSFSYQVIGAICRLYDRAELPYPCCRIQWKGKEPSWNRVGKRYVIDLASRRKPSYQVYLLSESGEIVRNRRGEPETLALTLFWKPELTSAQQRWWSRYRD